MTSILEAREPEKKSWPITPVVATVLLALVTGVSGYIRGAAVSDEKLAQHDKQIQMLQQTKVDKDVFDTDVAWIKATLVEIKSDVKELKKKR